VASVLADATVEGLFPARETRVAVRGDYPTPDLAIARYRRAADALGAAVPPVDDVEVGPANTALRSAVRDRYVSNLQGRYTDPMEAARDVRIGRVTVVVRTWSR